MHSRTTTGANCTVTLMICGHVLCDCACRAKGLLDAGGTILHDPRQYPWQQALQAVRSIWGWKFATDV